MPRSYRLGERELQMQATRERIVEAAIALYTEQGISATTLRQVQVRADVAPGTLRNHFPDRDHLERALVERLTSEAPLPDPSLLDGAGSLRERLERLIGATGAFLDQANRLYRMWLREPMLTPAWTEAGARYGAHWAELWRLTLGPLADDEEALAVVRAISQPSFFDAMRDGLRTTEQASALVAEVVIPWFEARAGRVSSD